MSLTLETADMSMLDPAARFLEENIPYIAEEDYDIRANLEGTLERRDSGLIVATREGNGSVKGPEDIIGTLGVYIEPLPEHLAGDYEIDPAAADGGDVDTEPSQQLLRNFLDHFAVNEASRGSGGGATHEELAQASASLFVYAVQLAERLDGNVVASYSVVDTNRERLVNFYKGLEWLEVPRDDEAAVAHLQPQKADVRLPNNSAVTWFSKTDLTQSYERAALIAPALFEQGVQFVFSENADKL